MSMYMKLCIFWYIQYTYFDSISPQLKHIHAVNNRQQVTFQLAATFDLAHNSVNPGTLHATEPLSLYSFASYKMRHRALDKHPNPNETVYGMALFSDT